MTRLTFGDIPPHMPHKAPFRRQQEILLESGIHPATGERLRAAGGVCGACNHHSRVHYAKIYHKCDLAERWTHGPGTDIKMRWPACELFEAGDGSDIW